MYPPSRKRSRDIFGADTFVGAVKATQRHSQINKTCQDPSDNNPPARVNK